MRTRITFYEIATFQRVDEFISNYGKSITDTGKVNKKIRDETGAWCSNADFEKYLKVISRS